jgi:hypothetical protein
MAVIPDAAGAWLNGFADWPEFATAPATNIPRSIWAAFFLSDIVGLLDWFGVKLVGLALPGNLKLALYQLNKSLVSVECSAVSALVYFGDIRVVDGPELSTRG